MNPQLLSDYTYAFLHYNCKYPWLRPTQEIVEAYKKLYGTKPPPEESSESFSEEQEESEEEGEAAQRKGERSWREA